MLFAPEPDSESCIRARISPPVVQDLRGELFRPQRLDVRSADGDACGKRANLDGSCSRDEPCCPIEVRGTHTRFGGEV